MNEGEALRIRPLTDGLLEDVIRIHLAGMGYTLNSRLGWDHMRYLYRTMADDQACYVGVALVDDRPVGVVSGSVDAGRFTSKLFKTMSGLRLASIASTMLLRPWLIWLWWQGIVIGAPVQVNSEEVKAVLTAIAVDPKTQRKGIGRALVDAFEGFLRERGVDTYKLDTQITNERARKFYRDLGFQDAARRADSVVFVRQLS
jgi:ribosomal protein S18 acetylase RimI-like enzyme